MSCMPISIKALAGVRETLSRSFYWKEATDEKPIFLKSAFAGAFAGNCVGEKNFNDLCSEFVEQAFIFNSIEYYKGKQARINAEPKEWRDFIFCLKNYDSERLSVMQLYKTLQMIDYNTEPKGWMNKDEYNNWSRKEEFENFKKTLGRIISCLASHIIARTEAYEKAVWSLE